MIKRFPILLLMAVLLGAASLWARPSLKSTCRVQQPDGSFVTIRLAGDEYRHYNTTSDGYSLVRNADGYYVYACQDADGQLAPTALVAHDAEARTAEDVAYLQQTGRIVPPITASMQQVVQQNRAARAKALSARKAASYDYSKFRGLVILVEYNDCPFRYSDYNDIMTHMINDDDYQGESRTNIGSVHCTGSMRDYFRDNSSGIFVPTFDVIGPVKVERSQYYTGNSNVNSQKTRNSVQLMIDACTAADSQINFADYDVDNDGAVDMIYFIYSGLPSYIAGNDDRLLWPHQYDISYMKTVRKDGVKLARYACSTELYGSSQTSVLEGIGTICHEFSHVLGLPDFYDTNNDDDRACPDPGLWSLMANGADFNYGRTPCAYSLYERYALGFATPQQITEPGSFSLEAITQSNTGYRISSPVRNEFFLLENRQKNGWDAELPGHGLLVFRVDSTNAFAWYNNVVNDNPDHPYYEMLRAGGQRTDSYGYLDTSSDPFPGTAKVTHLDNETSPANLKSWSGRPAPFGLDNIKESGGVITFDAFDANVLNSISLNEKLTLGIGTTAQLTPVRKPANAPYTLEWTVDNNQVASVSQNGLVTGLSAGTAHITVTANNTLTATCEVTVSDAPVMADIAAFRGMSEDSEALLKLTDAEVLFVKSSDIYLRDASGSIILNSTGLSVKKNDRLNGVVYGQLRMRNKMPVLGGVSGQTNAYGVIAEAGDDVEGKTMHISQLNEDYYGNMVVVEQVKLERNGGVFAIHGDKRIRLYNTLTITSPKITVPTDLTKRYNITAIFGTNTLNGDVIDEFYLLKSPVATAYTEVTALSLPENIQLAEGRTRQLTPTLTPSNADVFLAWHSSDESVAVVDQNGLVTAVANGLAVITVTDRETGLSAQTSVTVGDRLKVADIAAFRALSAGIEAELTLTDAQVLYVHSRTNFYVRDASGSILIKSSKLSASKNDMLNGTLFATMTYENQMPVLVPIDGSENGLTATSGTAAEPRPVSFSQLTDADLADLVLVQAVQLTKDGGIYAVDGDHRARLYNTFGITSPKITVPTAIADKYFDVTAIYGTNTVNGAFTYELYLLKSPVEVPEPDAITAIEADQHTHDATYNLKGQRVTNGYRGLIIINGHKVLVR